MASRWLMVIVALASLILGMGMPTVAVYILLSMLLAPAGCASSCRV